MLLRNFFAIKIYNAKDSLIILSFYFKIYIRHLDSIWYFLIFDEKFLIERYSSYILILVI